MNNGKGAGGISCGAEGAEAEVRNDTGEAYPCIVVREERIMLSCL